MAASQSSTDESLGGSADLTATDAVRAVLKRDPALARGAYDRTAGYRERIQDAVEDRYDAAVSSRQVNDVVLEANRLDLLYDWSR
jgi:hypothetical protein